VSSITPASFGVKYENVEFRTADGVVIKGWFVPSAHPHAKTILLLHGYPADKGDILPTRIFLHKNYNLFFLDFRYLGESGGSYSTLGSNEVRDIRGALDYLHARGINEVAVWGLSMGGAAALMAMKSAPEIKAMVAESPYARLDWLANQRYPIPGINLVLGQLFRLWGYLFLHIDLNTVRPMTDAASSKIPLLLLFSRHDELVTYQHASAMQEAVQDNPRVRIIIYDGKMHAEPADNYEQLVGAFFAKYFP
jgi:pimeloyl-ACP methyl ester carboxylesterase